MKKLTDEERKERCREINRRYRLKNKDKISQNRLKDKDKVREYHRQHRLKNPDKYKEYERRQYLKNKDKIIVPINPMTMTKSEIEALEAKIARLKAKPLEELIYKRA